MIIHNVLNRLFSSPASVSVLRELTKRRKGLTGREISRETGLTPQAAHNTLKNLEDTGIVKREFAGRSHYFTLNREHHFYKTLLENLFESERNFSESLYKKICNALRKVSVSVILYGSVARREETAKSDLDICIITDNRKEVERIISDLRDKVYIEFGVTFAPFLISEADFRKKLARDKSPVKEIVEEGKVLSGKSFQRLKNG